MHRDIVVLKRYGRLYAPSLFGLRLRREARQKFLRDLIDKAEDGVIALVWGGRDCDGVRYQNSIDFVEATKQAVEASADHTYEWADGPCSYYLERPSVAKQLEYDSRDLALEAFEDEHNHCIYD